MTKLFSAIFVSLALPTSFIWAQGNGSGILANYPVFLTCVQSDPTQPPRPTNVDTPDGRLLDPEACQGDDTTCAACLSSIVKRLGGIQIISATMICDTSCPTGTKITIVMLKARITDSPPPP